MTHTSNRLDLQKLRRVLELERSRSFRNTAVSGGLDKFLERFGRQNPGRIPLPTPDYRTLTGQQREAWIQDTMRRISTPGRTVKPPPPPHPPLSLDSPLTAIKGITARIAPKFEKLGVHTVRDMLYFFPRRHFDYSSPVSIAELEPGAEQTILVKVWQATLQKTRRGMELTKVVVADRSGMIPVTFFNQPYLAQKLKPGAQLILTGRLGRWKGNQVFKPSNYEFVDMDHTVQPGQLVPVYPLTEGLYPRQVRRLIRTALDAGLGQLVDYLPEEIRRRARLIPLGQAIQQIHYPPDESARQVARRRLAFDELFLMQVGVFSKKRERQETAKAPRLAPAAGSVESFLAGLPFALTSAQRRALDETVADLRTDRPMSRLLHGDVGSGKTVVATAAMIHAVAGGCQAALMVPTEILAEQHFRNITRLLNGGTSEAALSTCPDVAGRPIQVGLLTGSIREKVKRDLQRQAAAGQVDILIGTQALIQKRVEFSRLAMVVVDEQHRFGVMQRLALKQKGVSPHMLVMSATPIPRTLALTLYGDLDISLIDELPPGRQEIKTRWLAPQQRQRGYDFVRKQVREGRQAYIICPLVEESENIEARAAISEYERLSQEVFPDLRLGLLHGRMSGQEKDDVMRRFRERETDILVSTSVVEVGVDVPNATVMLVEGADRFGLSQLHQFRGRVWRSSHQAYCILLADNPTEEARERLSIMQSTHDGFRLAEEDLRMRGPGEFFGTRQSGLPDLRIAKLTDVQLLELARREAKRLFEADPNLARPEHKSLAREAARLWAHASE